MYKLLVAVTLVLLATTLICGFWLRYSGQPIDDSSRNFHMTVALLTTVSTIATLVMKRRPSGR